MSDNKWFLLFVFFLIIFNIFQKKIFGLGVFEAWPRYSSVLGKAWVVIAPSIPPVLAWLSTYTVVKLM